MDTTNLLIEAGTSCLPPATAAFLDLLRDDHPRYQGRGANEVSRLRGDVFLSLAAESLPEAALIFVLEEIDNGADPWLIAIAAHTLRSFSEPRAEFTAPLLEAVTRSRYRDRIVEELPGKPTVVQELLATLAWLGPMACEYRRDFEELQASLPKRHGLRLAAILQALPSPTASPPETSCCLGFLDLRRTARANPDAVRAVELEDHTGAVTSFQEAFAGRPSVVAFFYTRCDNPLRCSLTMSQLAAVQRFLAHAGAADRVQVTGITYDPGFDLPARLRTYAEERGLRLGEFCRMYRSSQLEVLRNHFGLGVSFLGSLVNRHRIELFVLDAQGRTVARYERFRWNPEHVASLATELLRKPAALPKLAKAELAPAATCTAASSVLLLLLPKCPACWAAYASLAGFAGAAAIPLPLLRTLLLVAFGMSFIALILTIRARRRAS